MSTLLRFTRPALALMLVACAFWVALPLVGLVGLGDGPGGGEPSGPSAVELVRRGSAVPPKHVIPDALDPPASQPATVLAARGRDGLPQRSKDSKEPSATMIPTMPLPPTPEAITAAPPAFDFTYRSTVDTPPPPLLDANAPPPFSVAWPTAAARPSVARMEPAALVGSAPSAAASSAAPPPETYVIRDGDDLTGIAMRFFGNPAAADAIWHSNRDRLQDPAMLPIGLVLRLPTAGAAGLPTGRRQRLIEPN